MYELVYSEGLVDYSNVPSLDLGIYHYTEYSTNYFDCWVLGTWNMRRGFHHDDLLFNTFLSEPGIQWSE